MKKLLLLGATGRTGKHVLQLALQQGYQVTCLVRDVSKVESAANLKVFEGNADNEKDLANALQDVDVVISTLNVSRVSDFPWAPLRTPKTFMSDVLSKLIELTDQHPIEKLIICSAWGVAETKKEIPFWFRWLIDTSNIGAAYRDHERQEVVIEASNLNWIIVRPVGLLNSNKKQQIKQIVDNRQKPKLTIYRNSVATYLLDCVANDDLIGKKVVISGA